MINQLDLSKYFHFTNDLLIVTCQTSKKQGVIDKTGKEIIPCMYDDIKNAGNNWIVKDNYRYGVIDSSNNIIIPFEYKWIYNYYEHNFVNSFQNQYDWFFCEQYDTECKMMYKRHKQAIIHVSGKVIVPFDYHVTINILKNNQEQLANIVFKAETFNKENNHGYRTIRYYNVNGEQIIL